MPVNLPPALLNAPSSGPNPVPANAARPDRGNVDGYQAVGSQAHRGAAAASTGLDAPSRAHNGTWLGRTFRRIHGMPPLWAEGILRGLSGGEATPLGAHLRLPATLRRDRLVAAAEQMITPDMTGNERKMILDRLLPLADSAMDALLVHLDRLQAPRLEVSHRRRLTGTLLQIPASEIEAFLGRLDAMMTPDVDVVTCRRLTELLGNIPSRDQEQFAAAMRVFFPPGISDRDCRGNWTRLSLMNETQIVSAVSAAAAVVTSWSSAAAPPSFSIVSAIARVTHNERAGVVDALQVLGMNGAVVSMDWLTLSLGLTPGPERPRLVQQVLQFLDDHVAPEEHAWYVTQLVESLAILPAADREAFGALLEVANVSHFPSRDFVAAFNALALIPSEQRASVARYSALLQRDDLVAHFASVISAVGQVEEQGRAAFVQICLDTLYVQPISASALVLRLASVAVTLAPERAEHARRLGDGVPAGAATHTPEPPRVDLENVMNHHRQGAAEAVAQRLQARFPNGEMRPRDPQALARHLAALRPILQISAAQQRQQWHALAQHMASMPAPAQGPLQPLIAAMTEPTPEAPPLQAWAASLDGFAKAAGFAPFGQQESMADYHPPTDAQATTLASWLGHLQQFAYVPRGSSAAQPEGDGHIEAFVAHVRQFEISTLPVLARVRGRTRATELENARRTLVGERRPGDYSDAVLEDPSFKKLVGMVWQAIEAAPPQDQANMRHSLVMALAQCIEDDGHRVCGVGQAQRFVGVVEAQTFTPSQKLTALSEDFAKARETPTPAQVQDFKRHALREASSLYGADTPDMNEFERLLGDYIRFTY